ncbi:MAG: DUF2293 domain-containing protein [Polyangiaceae bacterium]
MSEKPRRRRVDTRHAALFAAAVAQRFPSCPPAEAQRLARAACLRDSGRVGDLVSGAAFSEHVVEVAVIAHIRHRHTRYEALLASGWSRDDAVEAVREEVSRVLVRWTRGRAAALNC